MPATRPLHAVPASTADLGVLVPALEAALDGTGPAVLPLPGDPARRVAALRALRPDDPAVPLDDPAVSLVIASSGSTGGPKGVQLTAAALRASGAATLDRLGGPAGWLLTLPPDHVAGLQVVLRATVTRQPLVVHDLTGGFTAAGFAAATEQLAGRASRRCTSLVPTQLVRLLDDPAGLEPLLTYDAVLVGGAATPPALLDRARAAGVRVVTTYGMSETCGGCVYDGRPLRDVTVRIGADGRVRLGGPVVFAGYRLRPDLTALALEDGEHITADLGRLDGERLVVLGRADDVVVTGGENVALPAVEAALAEHPGVREAAAVGVDDPEWGSRVVAAVVPRDAGAPPTLSGLRDLVVARLGRAAAPRQLLVLDALPLLGPGKLDRRALRSLVPRSPTTSLHPTRQDPR